MLSKVEEEKTVRDHNVKWNKNQSGTGSIWLLLKYIKLVSVMELLEQCQVHLGQLWVLKQQPLECPVARKKLLKLEQQSCPVHPCGRQHKGKLFPSLPALGSEAIEEEKRYVERGSGEGREGVGYT